MRNVFKSNCVVLYQLSSSFFDNHEIDFPNYCPTKMVKLFNNDKITIFHLEVQTAREAGDRGFQMSLNRLYNAMGWRWH